MYGGQCPYYESDDDDDQDVYKLGPIQNLRRICVKFVNKTGRPIDVDGWDDCRGSIFRMMGPNTCIKEYTRVEFPWKFYDAFTYERYVVNNKRVFKPPTDVGFISHWNITPGVRTLRRAVLVTLGMRIKKEEDVDTLRLPHVLAEEVKDAVYYMNWKCSYHMDACNTNYEYIADTHTLQSQRKIWKVLYLSGVLLLVDLLFTHVIM